MKQAGCDRCAIRRSFPKTSRARTAAPSAESGQQVCSPPMLPTIGPPCSREAPRRHARSFEKRCGISVGPYVDRKPAARFQRDTRDCSDETSAFSPATLRDRSFRGKGRRISEMMTFSVWDFGTSHTRQLRPAAPAQPPYPCASSLSTLYSLLLSCSSGNAFDCSPSD